MKLKVIYLLILTASAQLLNAQNIYNRHQVFGTIMDASSDIHPYNISGNPAFLQLDSGDQLLSVESNWNNVEGDYKKFLEPGTERLYRLDFSGKKNLDSSQIFKGMFSLNRLERHNWYWLSVKNYDTGSPFLLGDLSSGRTRYNGIFMNAQYSNNFTKKFTGGFSISYAVDEGLKEVAPRPTSEHRDIDVTLGGAYRITSDLSAGLSFRVFDMLEQINYREDESSIYQETMLLKLRGFDYPLIISKKVESRYSYHNRYYLNSDLFYNIPFITASAYFGAGTEQIVVKENISNPLFEGYWNNDLLNGGVVARISLSKDWSAGLSYKLNSKKMWAKHPAYNVLIMENNINIQEASAGLQYDFTDNFSGGIELKGELTENDYKDYYGDVSYSYKRTGFNALAGIDYRWSDDLRTTLAAGGGSNKNSSSSIITNTPSLFFLLSRHIDLLYIDADLFTTRIHLNTEINTSFPGIIIIHMAYINNKVDGDIPVYSSADRSYFNAAVELKINVY
jgi:hypothetical protein